MNRRISAFDRTCEGLKPDGPGAAIEALEAPQSPKGRPQPAFLPPAGAGARCWSVRRDTCPLPPDVLT